PELASGLGADHRLEAEARKGLAYAAHVVVSSRFGAVSPPSVIARVGSARRSVQDNFWMIVIGNAYMRWAPHPGTLRQLQYVVAVADTRSFRQAASMCAVSQPSLSAQVAQLERTLGVALFERSTHRVLLTRAGEELLARARDVLREADDFAEAAARLTDP